MLADVYKPKEFESSIYEEWERQGYFKPINDTTKPSFSIILPPPNVTGILHMGHALTVTIQDIVVRYKRMQGFNTVWVPGTDHAGIATQMVVEREIAKEGLSRHDLGREKFLEKVWETKEKHHDIMVSQMKVLGGSLDWSRERFSLDEGFSKAVNKILLKFSKDGTLYQGERLISWCHRCGTALSDLEVDAKEENGKLYYIKYQIENLKDTITIATTRPETLLGDTAVAINPNDTRFKHLHNKKVIIPIVNRTVPIILDEHVEMDFGTACLKITPAHDFNDYEIGEKHGLARISVINFDGKMNKNAGQYEGLSTKEARLKILEDLEKLNVLDKIEDYKITMSRCSRCSTRIEPLLSKQWFLKMEKMAKRAVDVVKKEKIKFYPQGWWEQTYYNWLDNIRDWCISRQLWWGHRLPIWYCESCGEAHVLETAPNNEFTCKCGSKKFRQDNDVLDTWFSAALWPFVGFDWPENKDALKTFYPNGLMETGFDILFFWVARMIMFGLEFMDDVPFKDVLFHAMLRDKKGQKMSKTKGNVIDPLEVTDKYSVDALRYTLASMAGRSRDVKMDEKQIESANFFMNKIWQASRFVFSKADGLEKDFDIKTIKHPLNKWVFSKFYTAVQKINTYLTGYDLDHATNEMYKFFWGIYCDWYLEFSKPILEEDNEFQKETQFTLFYVHREALKLMHVIIPFVTEKIYQEHPLKDYDTIMLAKYPEENETMIDLQIEKDFQVVMDTLSTLRNMRAVYNINAKVDFIFVSSKYEKLLNLYKSAMTRHGNMKSLTIVSTSSNIQKSDYIVSVLADIEIYLLARDVIDFDAEKVRLTGKLDKLFKEIERSEKRLNNEKFIQNAQKNVIEKEKDAHKKLLAIKQDLDVAIQNLGR